MCYGSSDLICYVADGDEIGLLTLKRAVSEAQGYASKVNSLFYVSMYVVYGGERLAILIWFQTDNFTSYNGLGPGFVQKSYAGWNTEGPY